MNVREYVRTLETSYFERYLPEGGAAFRLVLSDSARSLRELESELSSRTERQGGAHFLVRSADTRIHLIDQLFFSISRSIDWAKLANRLLKAAFDGKWKETSGSDFLEVGSNPDSRDAVLDALRKQVGNDSSYCSEFKIAITHLLLSRVTCKREPLSPYGDLIQLWLRGELPSMAALKPALLFRRIQRSSARQMLYSTVRFLRQAGHSHTTLLLDMRRYIELVPVRERNGGCYYSAAATMELYEMLRELIDDLERIEGTMIVATGPQVMEIDDRRGIHRYQALKMRLWDDFAVHGSQNPLSPMVRLS